MSGEQNQNSEFAVTVPEAVTTWEGLRPYFADGWAKLLAGLPLDRPRPKPPTASLCIDGRGGVGHVWMYWVGEPGSRSVHLEIPATETLVAAQEDDDNAAHCRFAEEVLAAVRAEPAATAAHAVLAAAPKAVVRHDAVDPEHGWYKPFKVSLANLLKGKLPAVEWTFDFDPG